MSYIFFNDNYIPKEKAHISIEDRGLRFGDGVFETILIKNKSPYQLDLHIERLIKGLNSLKINSNLPTFFEIIRELTQRNDIIDGFARIMITRGEGSIGYLPQDNITPNIIIETYPNFAPIPKSIDLWLSDIRKIPTECLPKNIKSMQGLNSTLARMQAKENNCYESLQLDIYDNICEGSSSNIFWIKENQIFTPNLDLPIVEGTIRKAIINLSETRVIETKANIVELYNSNAIFLTNIAWQILPISKLLGPNGQNFVYDANHAIIRELKNSLNDYILQSCKDYEVQNH